MIQYKYDLHVHTSEVSYCGKTSAKDMVRMYKDAGYQGVVITDHYYRNYFENLGAYNWEKKISRFLEGYYIALDTGEKLGLQVFPGMEIRFDENPNDYLVYGIDEDFLNRNQELYKLGLKEFKKLIEGSNILIIQAHPFRPNMIPALPGNIDGIEVYNGNPRHNSHNHQAYEYALKHQLLMVSGSDFHQNEDLARGGIVFSEIICSEDLTQIIKDGPGILIREEL